MPAWSRDLKPGDVVLFRFPCAEEHPTEDPKRRTCLVLEVADRGGRRCVQIAYGASSGTSANTGDELPVSTPDKIARAGLRRPTRFVCARRLWVSLDHPGWGINAKHPTPVIGQLTLKAMARLNAIRARIHALRDIAADCRAPRPGTSRSSIAGDGRSPVPERRCAALSGKRSRVELTADGLFAGAAC